MSSAEFPCAILAGGLATRLYPLTQQVPKAMLEIAGEPFIRHQLRLLRANGVTRAVLCVGYLGEMIRDTLEASPEPGIAVQVQFDGPQLLGTAGALAAALPLLGDDFFVMYGDSYLPCDFRRVQDVFLRSQKQALMTVFRNEGQWDRSNVEFDAGQIVAYDKRQTNPRMRHIDYGLGVLSAAAFEIRALPGDPFDLADLYQRLLACDQLAGCEVFERFYEIGSFAGLEETRRYLAADPAISVRPA